METSLGMVKFSGKKGVLDPVGSAHSIGHTSYYHSGAADKGRLIFDFFTLPNLTRFLYLVVPIRVSC